MNDKPFLFGEKIAPTLTWVVVLALPILVGVLVHSQFTRLSLILVWVIGLLVFAFMFCFVDAIWRTIRAVLTGGKTERIIWWRPPKGGYSDYDKFFILTNKPFIIAKTKFSEIECEWPHNSTNPLFAQAFALLRECREPSGEFNRVQLKQARPALEKIRQTIRENTKEQELR